MGSAHERRLAVKARLPPHHGGITGEERRHDGRVAVDRPNTRGARTGLRSTATMASGSGSLSHWTAATMGTIAWVATIGGIDSGNIRDLMIESVEQCFGFVNRLTLPIEWLSDNGSPYTARETRALAREIGLVPCTTPIESPQSNGMA